MVDTQPPNTTAPFARPRLIGVQGMPLGVFVNGTGTLACLLLRTA
jgi:hypothetical protein